MEIKYNEWREEYEPIINQFFLNAPNNGILYHRGDLPKLLALGINNSRIWTVYDEQIPTKCPDVFDIYRKASSGVHTFNSVVGYYITKEPAKYGHNTIVIDIPIN